MKKEGSSIVISLDKLDILDEIRENFYQNTGLIVSFHYPNVEEYDFYPVMEKNEYCQLIQSTPVGLKKCFESDKKALEDAKIQRDYCVYTCHAGLVNAVIPLEYKSEDLGSIYTGQVLIEHPREETFKNIYKTCEFSGVRYDVLKRAFFKTKVIEKEKLIFGIKLLSIMAHYLISVENELYLQKELFKKDKEILKHENEKITLQNELQNLSISILEYEKKAKNTHSIVNKNTLKNNHIVAKAQLFIKTNYHKKISLGDVAKAVYLSPNYFSSMFKKISGYTFSHYLLKTRITVAKKFLAETEMPIKEIVYNVGFEDYNYFNRIFKRIEGLPPAKFRKTHRNL